VRAVYYVGTEKFGLGPAVVVLKQDSGPQDFGCRITTMLLFPK